MSADTERLITELRETLKQFVGDGYRDDDGVWHEGPLRAEALAKLDALAAALEESEAARAKRIASAACRQQAGAGR